MPDRAFRIDDNAAIEENPPPMPRIPAMKIGGLTAAMVREQLESRHRGVGCVE